MIYVAFARGLLRRHVRRRPQRDAFAGERRVLARLADGLRDAEVHHDRMPAREHDVVGLHVAMHDLVLVCVGERVGDLGREAQRLLERDPAVAAQTLAQRLPGHQRHDVERQLRVAGDAGVEERQHVRMIEAGRDADLAEESLVGDRACEIGIEHLDRDVAVVLQIVREEDGRHAAMAELAVDAHTCRRATAAAPPR